MGCSLVEVPIFVVMRGNYLSAICWPDTVKVEGTVNPDGTARISVKEADSGLFIAVGYGMTLRHAEEDAWRRFQRAAEAKQHMDNLSRYLEKAQDEI